MTKPKEKIYEFHVENLRYLEAAVNESEMLIRSGIAKNNENLVRSLSRMYALLLGVWAECRFVKLIYEPNCFDDQEISEINSVQTQFEKWSKIIDMSFRKKYGPGRGVFSFSNMPHSVYSRYQSITELLEKDLKPVIEIRNKLAHGQWRYPLNSQNDDVETEKFRQINNENFLTLKTRVKIINYLSFLVNDLVISRVAFERDFDLHFKCIMQHKVNLSKKSYQSYCENLVIKYNKGKLQFKQNLTPS